LSPGSRRREFVWQGSDNGPIQLEIVQMPRGLDTIDINFTCWGEWNFALFQGSENVVLACDLISNLMGALKVTERGLHGACLPTSIQFYERYKGERCIPVAVRDEIKDIEL